MRTLQRAGVRVTDAVGAVVPGCWVPELPVHFVRRDRLEDRLDEAAKRGVTVVAGEAGAGKSVLLAGWVRSRWAGRTAWLELEPADNEHMRFWRRLVGALRVVDSHAGSDVLTALSAGVADARLAELVQSELAPMGQMVLVLDGLDRVTRPVLVDAIGFFTSHLPTNVHLVVAVRHPCVPRIHRLRLSGELTEIDRDELSFSSEEAGPLLSSLAGRPLMPADMDALMVRTEGWACGLRLAGAALTGDDDHSASVAGFGGDHRLVSEFFEHEVLAGEAPDTVRFMMWTSVVSVMTPELCRELSGRADAGVILEDLAGRHVFVEPVDGSAREYRYHPLFADFLRSRLAAHHPGITGYVHLRAAAWLAREGDEAVAVHHLAKAFAYDRVVAVAASATARRFATDEEVGGDGLLPSEVAESYLEQDPWRMYATAASLLGHRRSTEAAAWLERLERSLRTHPDRLLRGRVEMLWAIHDAAVWDAPAVVEHADNAFRQLGFDGHLDLCVPAELAARHPWLRPLDDAVAARLPVVTARAQLWLGHLDGARASLDQPGGGNDPTDTPASLALRAGIAHGHGQLREARALACAVLELENRGAGEAEVALSARLTLAAVLLERDQLDAAEEQLDLASSLCQRVGQAGWTSAWTCAFVRVLSARGRHLDALDRVGRFRRLHDDDPLPDRSCHELDLVEIHCRLGLRDLAGAELRLRTMPPVPGRRATLARFDLCAGRPDRVEDRLGRSPAGASVRDEIERLVLSARAHLQLGRSARADDALREAVALGRPDGYIRVFLDDTVELPARLRPIGGPYPDPYLAELIDHAGVVSADFRLDVPAEMVEPLTVRERALLGYLTTHMTQAEIARTLHVSHNTVKTHSKSVYRKLGAASRSQAVQTAQRHGLL